MSDLPAPELRSGPPWAMEEMIAVEPALGRAISGDHARAERMAALILQSKLPGAPITVVGCGTSEHAAMALATLLDEALGGGATSGRVIARQAFEAALDPWPYSPLMIGVSHEAETSATIAALGTARAAGIGTALITANADGPAAGIVDEVFVTPLLDRSWCHTVAYLSPILAGGAVAAALRGEPIDPDPIEAFLRSCLDAAEGGREVAERLAVADHFVVCGSGVDAIGARELALKIEEGPRLAAVGRDLETELHGHLVSGDGRTGLIALVTDPRGGEARSARAEQLLRAGRRLGMHTALIVAEGLDGAVAADATSAGRMVVPMAEVGPGVVADPTGAAGASRRPAIEPRLAALLGSGVALQLLALAMVHRAGTNPDLIGREEPAQRESAAIIGASFPI